MRPFPPFTPAEAVVHCLDHWHFLRVTAEGRLSLEAHPRMMRRTEEAFITLGGPAPRCLQVLYDWRRTIQQHQTLPYTTFPPGLKPALRQAIDRHLVRCRAKEPTPGWRDRLFAHLRTVATEALSRCRYRKATSRWEEGSHETFVAVSHKVTPTIEGKSIKRWSSNGRWTGCNSQIRVTLPLSWARVWRAGLAVVDGVFVLQLVEQHQKIDGSIVYEVLAGKQGQGFAIHPARAVIIQGCLHWRAT